VREYGKGKEKRWKNYFFYEHERGVGKTSLCVNLAVILAKKYKKKILIVDMDPQMNATQYLFKKEIYDKEFFEKKKTIHELFKIFQAESTECNVIDGVSNKKNLSQKKSNINDIIVAKEENLDMIVGNFEMTTLALLGSSDISSVLVNYFKEQKIVQKYDFIFIDCPPTSSIYTTAALLATNYYILVVKTDFFSKLGISMMKKAIEKHNQKNQHTKVELLGIICNMYREKQDKNLLKDIREKYSQDFFETIIPMKIIKIDDYSPEFFIKTDGLKKCTKELAKEFLKRLEEEK
jgi:hypothetical protein